MPKINLTAAHKFFLRYFIRPSSIDDVIKRNPNLGSSLGEDPKDAFKRFVTDGFLISASLQEKLLTLTVSELQAILNKIGLSGEGVKEELVIRILSIETNDAATRVKNIELFVCSDKGRRLIDDQLQNTSAGMTHVNPVKKTVSWLDEKGVTGNMIYDVLKFIGGAILMWLVNNKLALGNWINRVRIGLKDGARRFVNFIYEIGRKLRK